MLTFEADLASFESEDVAFESKALPFAFVTLERRSAAGVPFMGSQLVGATRYQILLGYTQAGKLLA